MEFRARDYSSEEATHSLPRVSTDDHPLITRPSSRQVIVEDDRKNDFYDPLRGPTDNIESCSVDVQDIQCFSTRRGFPTDDSLQSSAKEWASFKRSLMQKFSVSKTVSISSISNVIVKSSKANEKSSTSLHSDELGNQAKISEEDVKVLTRQEYVSRLRELKDEIRRTWQADDRVTSLKLSIKVSRLLMDTSVLEFYPTLFVFVTDVMDMLGVMVWDRIKRKAEYNDDGTIICSLPENFETNDVCLDAKETCYNWFCKIGSIRELLPRIYLELAILRCWRFLHEKSWESLRRLAMMMRGLADPLASAYCRAYMVRCAQALVHSDRGYLITCVSDIKSVFSRILLDKENISVSSLENKKVLLSLMEPTVEWIMRCICKEACQKRQVEDLLLELGLGRDLSNSSGVFPCISVILHHLLKELPAEIICSHAFEILQLIESCNDISFHQYLNYRLLGLKLCEIMPQVNSVDSILDKIFQVITPYNSLDEYLKVVDAYLDIVLQYDMDNCLIIILDGIALRAHDKRITEDEANTLQSIFRKFLIHFNNLEDAFALNHFVEILDIIYGSSRDTINMLILDKAIRNGCVRDPTTIQFLFEISQALHDRIENFNTIDDFHQQKTHLISSFIQMVDFGSAMERHLAFLVECRGALGRINELKEVLVHASNNLAIKAIKDATKLSSFIKACLAFNEVTIPAIPTTFKQMNLYLETAEVALSGGLLSHTDGLIDSAISCLQIPELSDGSQLQPDSDAILSLIRKLCSLLVIVPGNSVQGGAYIPRSILSLVESQPWITPRLRMRVFCAILSLLATLSQNKLPYHATNREVVSNDLLFFGDSTYHQELLSISSAVLRDIINVVQQEPHRVTRGSIALEACNCILSSFKASNETSQLCTELIAIAKSCLNPSDKYMQSTVEFSSKCLSNFNRDAKAISV